ncbi:hypothetical protein ACLMJK_008639 [Lecanora helva]
MPPPPSLPLLCHLRSTPTILHLHPHPQPLRLSHAPLRTLTTSPSTHLPSSTSSSPHKTPDRGPPSTETTQTSFPTMDVFTHAPAPTASIDACTSDGFHLDNGVKIGGGSGLLLVQGEAFAWRPWEISGVGGGRKGGLVNQRGQWSVGDEGAWGLLGLVWPKPDLLILGLGPRMMPLAPETRGFINGLGIRVDVQDTRNAAAQFNLLATERGVGNVAAALVPLEWREGR